MPAPPDDRQWSSWRERNPGPYDDRRRERDREYERDRERERERDHPPHIPATSALPPKPTYSRSSRSPPSRYRSPPARTAHSPDRERTRQASGSSSSRYRHPDSPEPGQILAPRERSPRPRPYAPKTDRKRSRSHSPDLNGSTAAALELFSKAMHSTLISTSTHALALQHFTRLAQFPRTDPTSTPFESAQKRVADAEKNLSEQMTKLHASFAELIKRTMAKPGVTQGDVSALEMDALKERMVRLEEMESRVVPVPLPPLKDPIIPVSAPSLPPPPPLPSPPIATLDGITPLPTAQITQMDDTKGLRRQRLRETLDDIIKRLESVESMRDTYEEKYNDLESQLDIWVGADMDKAVGSWKELESSRDPSGRLRGVDVGKDGDVVMGQEDGLGATSGSSEDIDAIRREIKGLRRRMENVPTSTSSGISAEDLEAVRAENKRLEAVIEAIGSNTAPRDEIRRLESLLKAKSINDARAADSTSTTLSTVWADIKQLQTSTKSLGESRGSQATAHSAISRSVLALAEEVKTLRTELKAVTDGREQWTKDVMTACLTMVKEELQQEYAKIAKKEIQSYVREFIARRNPATGAVTGGKKTPEPSVSPATQLGALPQITQPDPARAVSQPPAPPQTNTLTSSTTDNALSVDAPQRANTTSPMPTFAEPQAQGIQPPIPLALSPPIPQLASRFSQPAPPTPHKPLSARMSSSSQSQPLDLRARLSNPNINGDAPHESASGESVLSAEKMQEE